MICQNTDHVLQDIFGNMQPLYIYARLVLKSFLGFMGAPADKYKTYLLYYKGCLSQVSCLLGAVQDFLLALHSCKKSVHPSR